MRLYFLSTAIIAGLSVPVGFAGLPIGGEVVNSNKTTIVVPPPTGSGTTSGNSGQTASPTTPDILKFRNADLLRGSLLSASPSEGLRWNHPQVKTPISFGLEGLFEIQLGNATKPRPGNRALVLLTNGDSLTGELTGLTSDTLTLQTWYAGTVTIKRPMVAGLRPNTGSSASLYSGPSNLAEWERPNRGNSGWQFRNGALICSGGGGNPIGRDLKLPDMVNIECDLAWQGYPGFYMLFYVDNFDNYYGSDCYALQISGTTVYLQRSRRGSGMNNIESNVNVNDLQRRGKAHMALKVDKKKRTIALFLDDKLIKQWTDDAEFEGKGTGLGFVAQGQPLRISNLVVTEWDGRLDIDSGGKSADEDFLRLLNGDKLSGKLGTIAGGQVALTTSFATMQIPLERIVEVLMGTKNSAKARRQTNDMLGFFADGGRVTLALETLDGQQWAGTSENCGRLTVQRAALQKLQFNIYEPKPENPEDDWGGSGTGGGRRMMRGPMIDGD
jgi:hypothetical protein